MYRLQDVILEQSPALITLMELTAELDWYACWPVWLIWLYGCCFSLLSLALFAKDHSLVKPEFVKENIIHIKGGR